jgi:hypothetical protein
LEVRIIHTTAGLPPDVLGQLAFYNGMDNLTLPEIHEGIQSEMRPDHRRVYEFEMDQQSALLQMAFAGIPVDVGKRNEMIRRTQAEKNKIEGYAHQLLEAIGYYDYYKDIATLRYSSTGADSRSNLPRSWQEWTSIPLATRKVWKQVAGAAATKQFQKWLKELDLPFNLNSNTQKLRLFYHFFGIDTNEETTKRFSDFLPPWGRTKGLKEYRTRSTSGEYTPGVDRDTLEKLVLRASEDNPSEAAYWAQPFLNLCLHHADLAKTLQFLNCKLDKGWFYSSFGCVTETGRLSSKKSNFDNRGWNSQNVTPPLRIIFTSPRGQKSATPDYEQIESRMVAARCYLQFGAVRYLAATECGDLHSLACSMVWEDLPWPEDFTVEWTIKHGPFPADMVKAAKQLAKQEAYRGKSRRDCSKTLGHGSNYWGKPPNMAKQSHIDLSLVQHYQDVYFSVFPEIRQWHNWIIEQVQVRGEYSTIFGRPRRFFGRPSDDATIREAIAHDGQSPAADYTNRAMLRLHRASLDGSLPAELFLQKHDELGMRYNEKDETQVTTMMLQLMEEHFALTAPDGSQRDWYVPAEMLVGWNLGHRSKKRYYQDDKQKIPFVLKKDAEERKQELLKPSTECEVKQDEGGWVVDFIPNPDGLTELRGTDNRVRQRDPFATTFLGV